MKNQISAYDLACGGVQKEEFNNHWLELYREHNCYHVRMGKNGEKWSSWESFDSGDKSPLKLARNCYREFKNDIKNLAEYLYIIDINERGEFRAHVDNENTDETVFNITTEDLEDGLMKHDSDLKGLLYFLKEQDIVPAHATIKKGN